MIELSQTQDEEVGDGTTSVIVLGKDLAYFYSSFLYVPVMFMWNYANSLHGVSRLSTSPYIFRSNKPCHSSNGCLCE